MNGIPLEGFLALMEAIDAPQRYLIEAEDGHVWVYSAITPITIGDVARGQHIGFMRGVEGFPPLPIYAVEGGEMKVLRA